MASVRRFATKNRAIRASASREHQVSTRTVVAEVNFELHVAWCRYNSRHGLDRNLMKRVAGRAKPRPPSAPHATVVYMRSLHESWINPYSTEVPKLLAEYGAVSIKGARQIYQVEGSHPIPDWIAAFTFQTLEGIRVLARYGRDHSLRLT